MEEKIRVRLFGDFSLEKGSIKMDAASLHSNKLIKLLVYIILHRDRRVSRQELIDIFWEDNSKNPAGALKNLMYRLRTALEKLGDEEFIVTYAGAYQWNENIAIETDFEQLDTLVNQIRAEKDVAKQKQMCQQAITSYRVDMCEKLANETWIIPKAVWFRSQYMDVIKRLCQIYEDEQDWKNLEILCETALEVDSMEEDIHCWQIRSLYHQKKYDMAMLHYEQISKMLYDNLGIRETEKLHSVFVDMMADGEDHTVNIAHVLEEVREPEDPKGVFFCDYQIFRQIYRVGARRINRMGLSEYILLFTVRRKKNKRDKADMGVARGMEILEEILRSSLRIGDVVARYSLSQYIVLLPTCSYESSTLVAGRIRDTFCQRIGKMQLEILYEQEELTQNKFAEQMKG